MDTSSQIWKWAFAAWYVLVFAISSTTTFAFFFEYFGGWIPQGILDPFLSQLLSGIAGVLLFDIAADIWLFVYLRGAESSEQRAVSIFMSVTDFLCAAMASVAYLSLTATGDLALSEMTKNSIGLVALGVVILGVVLNFGSSLVYTRYEPQTKESVREANRRDRIERAQETAQRKLDSEVARKMQLEVDKLSGVIAEAQSRQLARGFYDVEKGRFEAGVKAPSPETNSDDKDPAPSSHDDDTPRCLYCGAELNSKRRKFCNANHRKYYHRNGPKGD